MMPSTPFRTTSLVLAALGGLCLVAVPGAAQLSGAGTTTLSPAVTINGDQASASLSGASLSTALYGIDVTVDFERAVGLSAGSLGLSARVVDPLDPALVARLPAGVSVTTALPLLVAIEPPAAGALSFSGLATLEVHTHDLDFVAACPFRLFASHDGGPFEDITDFMGMGSYRARGRTGGFSDFLILADLRPAGDVVDAKLARLWGLLAAHEAAIAAAVLDDLEELLHAAETAWAADDGVAAKAALDDFAATVQEASGSGIPDVWRSAGDLVNVAGELRAAAATLRFSLSLAG